MLSWLLLVYYILSCLYAILALRHRNDQKTGRIAISLLIPFAGLPLAFIASRAAAHARSKDYQKFEGIVDPFNEGTEILNLVDLNKETAIVPIEEALVINDHSTRRQLILDTIKEESIDLVSFLKKAVKNEDSETSHYAVTAILEMKHVMLAELQRWSVELDKHPDDQVVLSNYAAVLKRYLDSDLIDGDTKRTYQYLQADVLERLIEFGNCEQETFVDKIECELALRRYKNAEAACERYLSLSPYSEEAYYMSLKLYFTLRAGNKFNEVLEQLKDSPVKVSHRTLQMIRFWS